MTTRADNYSLHYRITRIERMLGIVNKWTSMPEGADIYTESGQDTPRNIQRYMRDDIEGDTRTKEQKQSGPNYVPIGGAGNGA
jgi:hypothetical protein